MPPMLSGLTVAVDLDGTCADFPAGLARWVADTYSIPAEQLPVPTCYHGGYDRWPTGKPFATLHDHAAADGLFATLEPYPDAPAALQLLTELGAQVLIVTARTYQGVPQGPVVIDTHRWLARHRIPYADVVFTSAKARVPADVWIDDAPDQLAQVGRTHGPGRTIVHDQPYNREVPGLRLHRWVALPTLLADLNAGRCAA